MIKTAQKRKKGGRRRKPARSAVSAEPEQTAHLDPPWAEPLDADGHVMAVLTAPLAPVSDAYRQRHVDVHLTADQALALRRLFDGLRNTGIMLANGYFINRPTDAVRWLLEQLGRSDAPGRADRSR